MIKLALLKVPKSNRCFILKTNARYSSLWKFATWLQSLKESAPEVECFVGRTSDRCSEGCGFDSISDLEFFLSFNWRRTFFLTSYSVFRSGTGREEKQRGWDVEPIAFL